MAKSRLSLIAEISDEIGDLVAGTLSGGTTTTGIDADGVTTYGAPISAGDDENRFLNAWLYVNAGTHIGVERVISSYTPSTHTFSVADAVTGSYDSTDVYEIHSRMSRTEKVSVLNTVLTQYVWRRCEQPLTLILDGDMEASGVTAWTAGGATLTKEASTGAYVAGGTQSLKLVSTTSGASAQSTAIPANPGETYYCQVFVKGITAGSALTLQPYDVTGSADITLSGQKTSIQTDVDGGEWWRLEGTFIVPDGCFSVAVRLQEAASGKTSYWDDLIVTNSRNVELPLPSWIQSDKHFEWVYVRDRLAPWAAIPRPVRNCEIIFDSTRTGGQTVLVSREAAGQPLYVVGKRYYEALATDAATTTAPPKWVKARTKVEIYRRLLKMRPEPDRAPYQQDLADAMRELGAAVRADRPAFGYHPIRLPLRAE